MKYLMETVSPTTASIRLGRAKIGHAVQKHDGSGAWYGSMTVDGRRFEYTGPKANMLHGLVQQANRVALCGRNDAELARKALDERNARVAAQAAADWEANAPIREMLNKVAADLGVRLPSSPRMRSTKVAI